MRLVFLGAPGSGKGTQAKLLAERLGLLHVSTGDVLRAAIANGTPLGRQAERFVNNGELVPDSVVVDMVREHLNELPSEVELILDGFPRTAQQAEALEEILARKGWALDGAVALRVPRETLVARLAGRRLCPSCGGLYHVSQLQEGDEAVCPKCQVQLVTREDDRPESVRRRLELYDRKAQPIEAFYAARGLLREVEADGTIESVFEHLVGALGRGGDGSH